MREESASTAAVRIDGPGVVANYRSGNKNRLLIGGYRSIQWLAVKSSS